MECVSERVNRSACVPRAVSCALAGNRLKISKLKTETYRTNTASVEASSLQPLHRYTGTVNIMLFLGSGISLPTWKNLANAEDIPDVNGITKAVLSGPWKSMSATNIFESRNHDEAQCPDVERYQTFLQRLNWRVSPFYEESRGPVNYEDLFYLTAQMRSTMLNPCIQPFVAQMREASGDLCWQPSSSPQRIEFDELCRKVCGFIECVVWKKLDQNATPHKMDLIRNLAEQALEGSTIERLVICTLNHDLLVEKLLEQAQIDYNDGFGEADKGALFDPSLLRKPVPVRLLKLHGSINWYRYQRREGEHLSDHWAKRPHGTPPHNGKGIQWIPNEIPHTLTGSYNKVEAYGTGIFKEFMHAFHTELFDHNLIVMSGYGWGDYAINQRLCEWLSRDKSHRIILLHKDEDCSTIKSGHVIWNQWDRLIRLRKIVVIRKWLEDTPTWSEIAEQIALIEKSSPCKTPTPLDIF